MIRNILQSIQGVEIYPIISMLVFFGLFVTVIIWFFRANKTHLEKMSLMPLETSEDSIQHQHLGGK